MRNFLTAILLSTVAVSAPAFANTKKHVAESKPAAATEVKPVDSKSSAPTVETHARPRKAKKVKPAPAKEGEVKSDAKPAEVKSDAKPVEAAPAK